MFDYKQFVMAGLLDGIATNQSRFVITERAMTYLKEGLLEDMDMLLIQEKLDKRDKPAQPELNK